MTQPTAATISAPPRRSIAGFIWAAAIFVVTAIIGLAMVVGSFFALASTIGDFNTIEAGRSRELRLGTGEWYVFGAAPNTLAMNQIFVEILDPSGEQVIPKTGGTSYSADDDGMKYESFGSFDVATAGVYTVTVDGPIGTNAKIGQMSLGGFIGLLVGGIVVGTSGFIAAVVILIVTIVRRSRSKRPTPPTIAPPPSPSPVPSGPAIGN